MRHVAILLALAGLAGCSAKHDAGPAPTTGEPVQLEAPISVEYLRFGQVALGELDPELAGSGLTVALSSGPPFLWKLGAGNVLRFLAPIEQGGDSESRLTLASATKQWSLPLRWTTRLSAPLWKFAEEEEDGTPPPDDLSVEVVGPTPEGIVTTGTPSIVLRVSGPVDPGETQLSLAADDAPGPDVSSWFTWDAASASYTLAPARRAAFLAFVRQHTAVSLGIGLARQADGRAVSFEQNLVDGTGSLAIRVVTAAGQPASALAGTAFVVRGFNLGLSRLVTLGADGAVTVPDLPADTYHVTQVLLEPGAPLDAFATTSGAGPTELVITVGGAAVPNATGAVFLSHARASGAPVAPRVLPPDAERLAGPPAEPAAAPAAAYSDSVTSGYANTTTTKSFSYAIPMGTAAVKVTATVLTAEYPIFVLANSEFNDTWSFSVSLPGSAGDMKEAGKVNQSHAQGASISFDRCVDVRSAAANGDVPVTGSMSAQNVADGLLPTSVTISIALGCDDLVLTQFSGELLSSAGKRIIRPRITSGFRNVDGQYLSIPRGSDPVASFADIPAELRYEPASATVTEVELFVRRGANDVSLGNGYLAQASTHGAGKISFPGLRLSPAPAFVPTGDRVSIVGVVRGTVNGVPAESSKVPLSIGVYSSFTPLYLAPETTGYSAASRYGVRDAGGDAWGTLPMLSFLFGDGVRYDDITAPNVSQDGPPEYRSTLGHKTHSDGQAVDLRYWDGAGGFTEPLNGAGFGQGISALAADALVELASTTTGPKLTRLKAWITQNRSNLQARANLPTARRLYIGDSFIWSLLRKGVFPQTTTPVPGVGAWTGKSSKITSASGHLHHWHLSTINP